MEVDAAQYAVMGWEMLTTHSFLKVHCLGMDYLDKPPLIFWLGSLSFSVFGFNNFAYKLPSLLFALLAVFSTYRLSKIYYDEKTARMAAVMLATCQAVFLVTNDVRTDTLLMGAFIFSVWQWTSFFEEGKPLNLLGASLGLALALLAKGPIGLVATGAGVLPQLILSGKWKRLFDFRLVLSVLLIALMLTPMCIGLYQQHGLKGLRFYFWTQSFGRITGESEWNNNPDRFFLLHTTAWAFLPWTLFLLIGWVNALKSLIQQKLRLSINKEVISVGGFTLVLIMLSLSKYQLPHYIFIVYPLAAIMAAKGFLQLSSLSKLRPWLVGLQVIFVFALPLGSLGLQYTLKRFDAVSLLCLLLLYPLAVWAAVKLEGGVKTFYSVTRYVSFRFKKLYHGIFGGKSNAELSVLFGLDVAYKKLFLLSAMMFMVFNFLLSAFYFPAILKYQPECDFGRYVQAHCAGKKFVSYNAIPDFSLIFYAQQIPEKLWTKEDFKKAMNEKKDLLIFASPLALRSLTEEHIPYTIIDQRLVYPVAKLSLPFLNPATRASVCDKVYLLEVRQ